MSRRNKVDNSTSVSLFPFLAVLLCTMGALLVVLVAVSRTARDAALDAARIQRNPKAAQHAAAAEEELNRVRDHLAKLKKLRTEAEKQLREDTVRMTNLENHMRRLQDELKKHVHAMVELEALEGDHYDDRKQAERECERLQQLIADKENDIEELKKDAANRKRTYSLVPYEGPNGTTRRPIIVECCKDGIVLQPEGVVISPQDLQPPLGSGNALAAALRAARDHYIRQHPAEGGSRDTEPYPMIVIRPDGTEHFGLARRAIEAADFDFGYEPVEQHWELNYGTPDPVLANIEQQALDQARARQELLAAAAPRAYRNSNFGSSGRFEYASDPVDMFGNPIAYDIDSSGGGSSERPTLAGAGEDGMAGDSDTAGQDHHYGQLGAGATGTGTGSGGPDSGGTSLASTGASHADGPESDSGTSASGPGGAQSNSQSGPKASAGDGGDATASQIAQQGNGVSSGSEPQQNSVATGGTPNDVHIHHRNDETDVVNKITPTWSEKRQHARAVAVRRTIRVIVREDHIGLLTDETTDSRNMPVGKTVPFDVHTVDSIDEFIKAVEGEVASWGIAGNNLYWRPVLEIQVAPDGQRRADDLARLLKHSEIEVKFPATATNNPPGAPNATR